MTEEKNEENVHSIKDGSEMRDEANNHQEGTQGEASEPKEPDTIEEQLDGARAEASENYDKFLRVTAEFENLRRRTEKERTDLLRFGTERLLKDLLPVIDSFEKAVPEENMDLNSHNPEEFVKGMRLVWKQMMEVLEKNGLTAIEAAGLSFDPNFHQAIQRIECAEATEEVIGDEYAKGYLLHDRLLRPSMVSVKVPSDSK